MYGSSRHGRVSVGMLLRARSRGVKVDNAASAQNREARSKTKVTRWRIVRRGGTARGVVSARCGTMDVAKLTQHRVADETILGKGDASSVAVRPGSPSSKHNVLWA